MNELINQPGHLRPARSGHVLIVVIIALPIFLYLVLLAVDLGRVSSTREELYVIAEAAARRGAMGLLTETGSTLALASATDNSSGGGTITVQSSDVETGRWSVRNRTFTAGTSNPNAVRVTVRRTSARGNAMKLTFGAAAGQESVDIASSCIAYFNPNVMLVVANTTLNTADALVKSRLEGLGFNVDVVDDAAVTANDAEEVRLVVISETCVSSLIGTRLRDVSTPVICYESLLYDDMGWTGPTEFTHLGASSVANRVTVVAPTHAIAAGRSGTVYVTTQGDTNGGAGLGWGAPSAGATVIATVFGETSRKALFVYDTGAIMYNGSPAPGRRVGFFGASPNVLGLGGVGANTWSTDGWAMFDAAVNWAAVPATQIRTVKWSQ